MKKTMLLVVGFLVGVAFIIHCGGGSTTKAGDEVQTSITDLQTKIDDLSARVAVLEKDNNSNLAENIKGTWIMTHGNSDGVSFTITFDGTNFSCSPSSMGGFMSPNHPCDGVKREYEINSNILVLKNVPSDPAGNYVNVGCTAAIADNHITILDHGIMYWHGTRQ